MTCFAVPGTGQALIIEEPKVTTVSIGVLAFRGTENAKRRWSPTADYLNKSIPEVTFKMVPLTLVEMSRAVSNNEINFVLTNTGNYVNLEHTYGVTRIATLRASGQVTARNAFGAVIFTRSDRTDIQTIKDLKGKKFMAVNKNGFGGFQMGWHELNIHGIDPFSDFSEIRFSGFPQDTIAYAVLKGEVDAGTFRTGTLENMTAEGKIDLDKFKILAPKKHADFPFLVSTRLYPEWPFAKMPATSGALAQQVAIALLSMPGSSPAALIGKYGGWTVPLDYQPVHELFKELRIGPYQELGRITLTDLFKQYGPWLVLAAALILLTAGWAARIEYLVARRTRELSQANRELEKQMAERHRLEDVDRQRQAELAHVSRLSTMGEMASGFAHELNQPLSAIINYAKGCVRRLRTGTGSPEELLDAMEQVSAQAERAAKVIRRIRSFVRKEEPRHNPVDLNVIIRDVAGLLSAEVDRRGVAIVLELADTLPVVNADAIQIEQVILNLARNSLEAMEEARSPRRRLTIQSAATADGGVGVSVSDTGPGMGADMGDDIFDPFYTSKPNGLGLGLSISRSIAESHGGRLSAGTGPDGGARFTFVLPAGEMMGELTEGGRHDRA